MRQWFLVTGAGSGIGRAIAIHLAKQSHSVVLMGRHRESLTETQSQMKDPQIHAIAVADIREAQSISKALTGCKIEKLDGVVANAGIGGENQYGSNDRWDDIIRTNLTGTYYTIQEALPLLRADRQSNDYRHVVVIASILARLGVPGYAGYCASKAGLLGLVRALAAEWAGERILVNAVCPGWVKTQMAMDGLATFAKASGKSIEQIFAEQMQPVPLGKMSQPEEIAAFVGFLLGEGQSSITGQTLDVNNGALMP